MTCAVIIPGAGRSSRFGGGNKLLQDLAGKPVLVHTIEIFEKCSLIGGIFITHTPGFEDEYTDLIHRFDFKKVERLIPGGEERQESVYRALIRTGKYAKIAVHDAARPLLEMGDLLRVIGKAEGNRSAILGVPIDETIKKVNNDHAVVETLDREKIWRIQTPQVFSREILLEAHEKARNDHFTGTDDAVLVERIGFAVEVIRGSYRNIKITTPDDLAVAEAFYREIKKEGASENV